MAKNLKLNIKNEQLASALNLKGKLKKPTPEKEAKEGVKEKEEGTTISRIIKEPHKEPYTPNPVLSTPAPATPAPVEEFEKEEPRSAPSFEAPEPTSFTAPAPEYPKRAEPPPKMEYPERLDLPPKGEQSPRSEYTGRSERPPHQTPRGDYTPRTDRPPRTDYTPRGDYTPRTDRPPRTDYTPRTDRPPRTDYTPRGDSAPRTDRPPRTDYTPRTDRPPRTDYAPRGEYTPRTDRPPRTDYTPRTDRPPRTDYTPRSEYTPRTDQTPKPEGAAGAASAGPKPPPPTFIRTSKGFVRADERGKLPSSRSDTRPERSPFPRKERPPHAFPRPQESTPPIGPNTARTAPPRRPSTPGADFRDPKTQKKTPGESRGFDARDRQGLRDVESENWRRQKAHQKRRVSYDEQIIRPKAVSVRVPIQIKELAAAMKLKASELVAKLFLQGILVTLNDFLEDETTIQLLGQEFDCAITIDTSEEKRLQITGKTVREEISGTPNEELITRPPIITFMGHVDHGKTSLIDTIRKSNVAAGESGAITQHIGAFRCHTAVGDLTILDTPGHEAFSAMRSRGANITDVVALVIAGDEGIRAQTIEAIEQARTAGVPIVVVLNKCDKPNFDPENVYRQLADQNLLPEAWGGTTVTVNCSATTGEGIDQLLEMLALQSEMLELRANPASRARGAVIESEMHKGMGSVATLVIQNGTLSLGDSIVFGEYWARIKTMEDEAGKKIKKAGPSTPVKITGLSGIPDAGSEFIAVESEKQAREIAEARGVGQKEKRMQIKTKGLDSLLAKHAKAQEMKTLNLVLRADVQGSLEALKNSLLKIKSQKVQVYIVSEGVGEISESDIQLAGASKASIVGFHTKIESHAEPLIKELHVDVTLYDIIYHAVDGVKKQMVNLLDKIPQENTRGKAEVKTVFKSSHLGSIAGCQVIEGTIQRNHRIKQIREGKEIWKGAIASLKRIKEDVREVNKGYECGILLQNNNEVLEGDILEAFDITYLIQEL